MKHRLLVLICVSLFLVQLITPASAVAKTGTSCSKLNSTTVSAGMRYTCIKSGTKLVWSKGVKVVRPTVKPSVAPTPAPSPSATDLPAIRTAALANNTFYIDRGNCHSRGINAELQALDAGNWKRLAGAMGWEDSTNCPVTQPVQPWVAIDIPAGTTLRWRFWLPGIFDVNSATFMSLTKRVQATTSPRPVATPSATATNNRASVAPTPTATATRAPIVVPTPTPTATRAPIVVPTPTVVPTVAPRPTVAPTPTVVPTVAPTIAPTPTIAPNSQSPLLISNTVLTGTAGSTITLTTSGGSGTGAVTFSVTGVGCSVNGSLLGSIGVVTCVVTATKAASPGHSSSISAPTTFTFGQQPLLVSNTVRKARAGTAITLTFSGGSGTGSVYYSVTGANCNVSTSDYKLWTLSAGDATTCSVTAKNNASAGYVSSTSEPATFEFFKQDLPQLVTRSYTDASLTKAASTSTLYPVGTRIYIVAESPYSTPGDSFKPPIFTVTGTNCTAQNSSSSGQYYGIVTATAAATCIVVGTKPASAGFNAVSSAPITFSFGVFNQIPFTIRGGPGEGGNGWLGTDGGSGTGAVTYSVTGANCSLVDGNKLRATAATSCVVTATKAASLGFNAVTTAPITIEFKVTDQKPLVVVKESLGESNQSPVGKVYNLSTTGGSGTGLVSYSVSGANCSVSGNTLTATAVTTCIVTAVKSASTLYNSVTSAPVNFEFFTYDQTPLTITTYPSEWPSPAGTQISLTTANGVPSGNVVRYYGGSGNGAVSYSVTGATCSINGTSLTANPTPGTFTTCVVTATKAASPGFRSATSPPVSYLFGIFQQQPLLLPNWNSNYFSGRIDLLLTTTGGSGSGAVSFSVTGNCYIEQGRVKGGAPLGGSATCTVSATKAGVPGRYLPISSAPVTLTWYNPLPRVDQSPLILVTSSVPAGVKSITLSTSGGSGTGAVGYTLKSGNCVISGSTLSASVSTSCAVNAYKLADVTYNLALSQTITFEFKLS